METAKWSDYGSSMDGISIVVLDECSRESYEYSCKFEAEKYSMGDENLNSLLSVQGPYRLVHVPKQEVVEEDFYIILPDSWISDRVELKRGA